MFNPTLLSYLVKKAQGDRKLTAFAKICGVSAGNLSKIISQKDNQAPKPETLQKIANHALNGVTYNDLVMAAGYNFDTSTGDENMMVLEKIKQIRDFMINSPEKIIDDNGPMSSTAIKVLVDALDFGIRQTSLVNEECK